MARSRPEMAAVSRAKALLETEVQAAGGGQTFRVAVQHTDPEHHNAVTFHYGPAFNEALADVIGHVRGIPPGEVDLLAEAKRAMDAAREDYPESEGYEVAIEAIVPHPDEDRHIVRRVEV
jgi:hypothetical protein